jgi:hypothetical protein
MSSAHKVLDKMTEFNEFNIFTPTPMLGYGYPLAQFWHGITTYKPSAIIIDGGSTDPGPYLLGTGLKLCSKSSCIRDLTPILKASSRYGIKVIISTAGGDGTSAHVDELFDMVREISAEHGYQFKVCPFWHLLIIGGIDLCRNSFIHSNGAL